MIKRLTMWQAKEGVTSHEALKHWRNEHADLARKVPDIRRYVQHHCVDGPEGGETPYTGLGEVWFDSIDSAAIATSTPQWKAVIEDADTFMDLSGVVAAWAEEHELIPLH